MRRVIGLLVLGVIGYAVTKSNDSKRAKRPPAPRCNEPKAGPRKDEGSRVIDENTSSQTPARIEANKLLSDSQASEAWENRPADRLQKEFYRFVGKSVPKGLKHQDAEAFMSQLTHDWEAESRQACVWQAINDIVDELSDPKTRQDYKIKKPTPGQVRQAAVKAAKGMGDGDLANGNLDLGLVAKTLIDNYPNLARK